MQSETCHCFLCPSFSVSLFFPASQHGSIAPRGETPIRTCGSCHPLSPPTPVSFSFPTSCDLPALSFPPSPCCLRSLSVSICTRPAHCNKLCKYACFAASLFLLRLSKSAPCATERGFNSCASYCSLLLMLHAK